MPPPTTIRDQRRAALLDAMADHLLAHGLKGSPLRELARAARTSDRMLLYYFADRDELLRVLLNHIAGRVHAILDVEAAPPQWIPLLTALWEQARTPALRPYLPLFFELATAAGRGEEPQRSAATRIGAGFIDAFATRLDPAEGSPTARAALLLATLDGLLLLDFAGHANAADAALSAIRHPQD